MSFLQYICVLKELYRERTVFSAEFRITGTIVSGWGRGFSRALGGGGGVSPAPPSCAGFACQEGVTCHVSKYQVSMTS